MKSSESSACVEPSGVGRGQGRVAGDRDEKPNLAFPGTLRSHRPGWQRAVPPAPPGSRAPGCASDRCERDVLSDGDRRWAANGNMAPPGRSRFPVMALRRSTAQEASVPNEAVWVPIRPYTAALGAAASSRATSRIVPGSMPVKAATASGVNGATDRGSVDRDPRS